LGEGGTRQSATSKDTRAIRLEKPALGGGVSTTYFESKEKKKKGENLPKRHPVTPKNSLPKDLGKKPAESRIVEHDNPRIRAGEKA